MSSYFSFIPRIPAKQALPCTKLLTRRSAPIFVLFLSLFFSFVASSLFFFYPHTGWLNPSAPIAFAVERVYIDTGIPISLTYGFGDVSTSRSTQWFGDRTHERKFRLKADVLREKDIAVSII